MQNTLIDAGPLIALFDKSDLYHKAAVNSLKEHKTGLISTWPVLTEVMHMISFNHKVQCDFLNWIMRGGITIAPLNQSHMRRIIQLIEKFSNVPMDLADASLVVVAEEQGLDSIFTIDSDFLIYRITRKKPFKNLFSKH
jgi:predicted nucleic acid-binding protein